ncbi:MAG: hypothetical protein M8861_02800 [marine benthic group bacterium]|nr:hypothetical protein [Gemmatimonadota bacterium]
MQADTLYTLIGYLGSALVVSSLAMRSILKLRLIGLAGAVTFVVYGYLIDAWPIVWTNVVIVLIHLHFLREIRKTDEYFKVLPVRTVSNYLRHFLDHFAKDIERAWPGFEYEPEEDTLTLFILRDLVPAGLFVANVLGEDTLELELDYAIPGYRDFKIGRFLYAGHVLRDLGYSAIVARTRGDQAADYLSKMGFERESAGGDTWRRALR